MGKYKEYIKESFSIQLKHIKEYKANFYFATFLTLLYSVIIILFLNVINTQFNDLLGWSFNEYYFFLVFSTIIAIGIGPFMFFQQLYQILLSGTMNIYNARPLNVFFQYFINTTSLVFGIPALYYIIFLIYFFLFLEEFIFLRFIFVLIFGMTAGIFSISLYKFIDSLAFFMKRNYIILGPLQNITGTFNRFPITMFKGWIKTLAFILPNVYFNAYATEIYFERISYGNALSLFSILIILVILFSILTYLNWHYGLKKYEAFG